MVSVEVVISRGGEEEVCMTRLSMRTKRSLHPPLREETTERRKKAGAAADERKAERA